MIVYSFQLHPNAQVDITESYEWYENRQKGLGQQFVNAVTEAINKICETPEAYGQKAKRNFREANVETYPFQIVYRVYEKEKLIFISSIHHEKKHPRHKYRR